MNKKKKPYQKPKLEELKMLEVGAVLCCKTSIASCTVATRGGKGQRVSTPS